MDALELTAQYAEAMLHADTKTMQSLWSDDFALDWVHSDAYAGALSTRAEMAQFWPAWLSGFSEYDFEITRTITAESVSVMQWIFSGTHTNPIGQPVFEEPISPSQRTIRLRGVSFLDITNGKISKETIYLDLATVFVELGVEV